MTRSRQSSSLDRTTKAAGSSRLCWRGGTGTRTGSSLLTPRQVSSTRGTNSDRAWILEDGQRRSGSGGADRPRGPRAHRRRAAHRRQPDQPRPAGARASKRGDTVACVLPNGIEMLAALPRCHPDRALPHADQPSSGRPRDRLHRQRQRRQGAGRPRAIRRRAREGHDRGRRARPTRASRWARSKASGPGATWSPDNPTRSRPTASPARPCTTRRARPAGPRA